MPQSATLSAKIVLITGCSSGIGRALAELLVAKRHIVWATARREDSVSELETWAKSFGESAVVRRLDVVDATNIRAVVDELKEVHGRIDCLVNNAGFGQFGAVEEITPQQWRRQFETNVFGVVELCRAVLPTMREQRSGRIVNVSSLAAHATLPLMGAYAASKHALDAVSSSLRMEVAPFGIDVVLIEPGPVTTQFRDNVAANLGGDKAASGPYARLYQALDDYWKGAYGRTGKTGDDVARLICKVICARRPRARYRITAPARLLPWILPFLPDRLTDATILRRMGWRKSDI